MRTLIDRGRLKLGLQSGPPIIWVPRASVTKADHARVLVLGWGWWMLYIGWRETGWRPDKVIIEVAMSREDYATVERIAGANGQEVSVVLAAALAHGMFVAGEELAWRTREQRG